MAASVVMKQRHAGLDHAGAFADAADADGASTQLEFNGDFLGPRVAGHDGFGSVVGICFGAAEDRDGSLDTALDVGHGHGDANAAGRSNEDIFRGEL
jgi:hypothetical protein